MRFLRGHQRRHFSAAGWAPGGPQVDHDRFALQRGEGDRLRIQRHAGELRECGVAGRECGQGGIAAQPDGAEQYRTGRAGLGRGAAPDPERQHIGGDGGEACHGFPAAVADVDDAPRVGGIRRCILRHEREARGQQADDGNPPAMGVLLEAASASEVVAELRACKPADQKNDVGPRQSEWSDLQCLPHATRCVSAVR